MPAIHIDKVSDIKTNDKGSSSKIHHGNDFYYINSDGTQYAGKDVEIDFEEKTSAKGHKYKVARILKVIEPPASNGRAAGITWDEYRAMAQAAHELADKLEPDGYSSGIDGQQTLMDRSTARAAILNTVMIAYSNGRIVVPDDEDMPF